MPQSSSEAPQAVPEAGLRQPFSLAEQQPPPPDIQSVRLHPVGSPGAPPILLLNTSEQLILTFDDLSRQNRQFRVEMVHYSRSWHPSPLSPSAYLDGFSYSYIQESNQSFSRNPPYRRLEYRFPNERMAPSASGNYLLRVYDHQGNNLLFSMPFFVTEKEGDLQMRVETLFAQRTDGQVLHQLFSTYRYPGFVEFPRFDLSIQYVQNQFWGRSRAAGAPSTSAPGQVSGYLMQDEAFPANYASRLLDIRSFEADGRQIMEYRPDEHPPALLLRKDLQYLDSRAYPASTPDPTATDRNARYARVHFSLETADSVSPDDDLYVVGDFNNWMISPDNAMRYDASTGLWKGTALIKQGVYTYKYIRATRQMVEDLAPIRRLSPPRQTYRGFVYFKDPDRNFDRLLTVEKIITQ
ncbi:type IX secretion system plug protein domain-containing protein [Fodinibius sediminis]|uniref:type IX secretion system plug protein n=1 Tax=Fodinibius sediminis TaxID=1214077 RepID=UPI00163DD435|nr:type IX secretion system plug protein domain-containing protein [Fodinibius sediminis]